MGQLNVQEYNKNVVEIYHAIHSGKIKKLPNFTPAIKSALLEKMPEDQKKFFSSIDIKSINAFIALAKKTSEKDFLTFINDPDSAAVKLTTAEMEALCGGIRWGRVIIGSASMVAIIGSIGLSAGGCFAGAAVYNYLYP